MTESSISFQTNLKLESFADRQIYGEKKLLTRNPRALVRASNRKLSPQIRSLASVPEREKLLFAERKV